MFEGYEIVVWFVLIVASITDLRWGKIYNHLTLTSMGAGVLVRLGLEGTASISITLSSIAIAFVFFFPLYYLKTLAAGDVKLLMAIAPWGNSQWVIRLSLTSILLGALVGLFILIKKNGILKSAASMARAFHSPKTTNEKMTRMPFAPAFFCSFLFLKISEAKGWLFF
ncbi:MAG: prepilin peptidase [Deltaproteobacteria bacterium]|nr:prepilin peptidase [Deltaproteobacteria bacterium]MBM4316086.1 prepilin peptidase [Deltaproteobacteria bacterium]